MEARMKAWYGLLAIVAMVAVTGCSTLESLSGGLFGASNKIETFLAAQVAGTYTVEIKKDGEALLSETWECTKDAESGKLTGCHKR
jgi:hypothetical protein